MEGGLAPPSAPLARTAQLPSLHSRLHKNPRRAARCAPPAGYPQSRLAVSMGWLKPAEALLEPKPIWDTHRDPPPDGPVPEPAEGVVADGQVVRGVRIGAAGALEILDIDVDHRKARDCLEEDITVDALTFEFVPIALLLGVPLMFKRCEMSDEQVVDVASTALGASEPIMCNKEELRYETKMYVYKLMTTPGLGLPLTWNQNGEGTKLPPVLACRSDGQPFTRADWMCLCEFHEYLDENYVSQEHLWYINKPEFKKWVGLWVKSKCLNSTGGDQSCAFPEINPCFEHRFPVGLSVKACNLAAKPEVNGRVGTVVKYDEAKLRIGVEFAQPYGLLSLKHTNLTLTDGGAARSKMLMSKYERTQTAQRGIG